MVSIEAKGLWWLPQLPTDRLSGVLEIKEGDFPSLALVGAFDALTQAEGPLSRAEVILGLTETGEHVTLLHCQQVGVRFAGLVTTQFVGDLAVIGQHSASYDDLAFGEMYVHFEGLTRWAQLSGFSFARPQRLGSSDYSSSVQYRSPDAVTSTTPIADLTFSVTFQQSGDMLHRTSLEEKTYITAKPPAPLHFAAYLSDVFRPLRNLIALGLGVPTFSTSVRAKRTPAVSLTPEGLRARDVVDIHYVVSQRHSAKIPVVQEMPFTLADLRPSLSDCFPRWFTSFAELKPVHDLYFASLYAPSMYSESRFLQLMQALESYHRRRCPATLLPSDVFKNAKAGLKRIVKSRQLGLPADVRPVFVSRLGHLNEFTLRNRIESVHEQLGECATEVVPDRCDFARKAADTRNYLTHFTEHLRARAASGSELSTLLSSAKVLMALLLTKELGLPDEKMVEITRKQVRLARSMIA